MSCSLQMSTYCHVVYRLSCRLLLSTDVYELFCMSTDCFVGYNCLQMFTSCFVGLQMSINVYKLLCMSTNVYKLFCMSTECCVGYRTFCMATECFVSYRMFCNLQMSTNCLQIVLYVYECLQVVLSTNVYKCFVCLENVV